MTLDEKTLFAFDCGATNWRLYRAYYVLDQGVPRIQGSPQVAPLTSFTGRTLPAALLLPAEGNLPEAIGDPALQAVWDPETRRNVRAYFKPGIGSHIAPEEAGIRPEYSHTDALAYTQMILRLVLDQIRAEKWPDANFDRRAVFCFAFPIHWRLDHDARVFEDFTAAVLECFPSELHEGIRFLAEPEAAIIAVLRQGLLPERIREGKVLLIDLGGSTLDIVVGRRPPGAEGLEYVSRYGAPFGGDDYDRAVAELFAAQIGIDLEQIRHTPASLALRRTAQRLKESLSRSLLQQPDSRITQQRAITLSLPDGELVRHLCRLSRDDFFSQTEHLQDQFSAHLEKALSMGGPVDDIQAVVLVGGGGRLSTIIATLRERFRSDRVLLADNPDELVVQGAALEYGESERGYRPTLMLSKLAGRQEAPDPWSAAPVWSLVGNGVRTEFSHPGDFILGRGLDSHLQLDSTKASRNHAAIRADEADLKIMDLHSTNGTFLNDERLVPEQPVQLSEGDQLRLADLVFEVKKLPRPQSYEQTDH